MTAGRRKTVAGNGAVWDLSVENLRALELALGRRGMKCDLDTRAIWPRLRVHSPYETRPPSVADFENSIVAALFDDRWWFAWLWAEKISEVTHIREAADKIAVELGGPDSEVRVTANPVSLVPPLRNRSNGDRDD
jgi:hypothetical protein